MGPTARLSTLADLTFDLKGAPEVMAKIQAAMATMKTQASAALYQEAEVEMTEAKARTPVDTGTLRDSGHVQAPVEDADSVSVTMGFGGAAAGYAIIVHEDVEGVVPRPGGVGQSKFLESVLRESAPYLVERIASRIKL